MSKCEDVKGLRHKRPDRKLYVPRARRSIAKDESVVFSECNSYEESPNATRTSNASSDDCNEESIIDSSDLIEPDPGFCNLESTRLVSTALVSESAIDPANISSSNVCLCEQSAGSNFDSSFLDQTFDPVLEINPTNISSNELDCNTITPVTELGSSLKLHKSNSATDQFLSRTNNSDRDISTPLNSNDEGSDQSTWERIFDENGDVLDSEVVDELTMAVGQVEIAKPKYDYLEFKPHDPDFNYKDFSHVIELYDFPSEFKTADLMVSLSVFKERGFEIKWVDDTHALAVFSSVIAANEALEMKNPFLKVRPLSEAISESKWKAKRSVEFLQPFKPRPQTSASLARRLVSGALGLKVQVSKEQRDKERKKIIEAKEKRKKVLKQKQDVWDGAT